MSLTRSAESFNRAPGVSTSPALFRSVGGLVEFPARPAFQHSQWQVVQLSQLPTFQGEHKPLATHHL